MQTKTYFVYILTNPKKTVLYTGITNNLARRLKEHLEDFMESRNTFPARYFCYNLVFYEMFDNVSAAIYREKEIKKWNRMKLNNLITSINPNWIFLNSGDTIMPICAVIRPD